MTQQEILALLPDAKKEDAEKFAAYIVRLSQDPKNPWMKTKTPESMAGLFRRVAAEGLVFDGVHITLQQTGISYDYVAYKNKMLLAYPESTIDLQLVYEGDKYDFKKVDGKVVYFHNISDPFSSDRSDTKIIGGYCVIKNKRGEFLTTLNKDEIKKHRSIAKTDYIWKAWFAEMCLKTVIKKGCKLHFGDIFQEIEEMDNDNYDLEKVDAYLKTEALEKAKRDEKFDLNSIIPE